MLVKSISILSLRVPRWHFLKNMDMDSEMLQVNYIILHRISNADGTSVRYGYDTEENLLAITNERGQSHRFTYDLSGRPTADSWRMPSGSWDLCCNSGVQNT